MVNHYAAGWSRFESEKAVTQRGREGLRRVEDVKEFFLKLSNWPKTEL